VAFPGPPGPLGGPPPGQRILWDDRVVNAPADEREPVWIAFGNGNKALLAEGRREDAAGLIARMGLQPPAPGRPVIVVCGGADQLGGEALERAAAMIGAGVAPAAESLGAAIVDGGTSAGVMELTGQARARRPRALPILMGVAPKGLVTYPGPNAPVQADGSATQRASLEENHSYFVLADSGEWGGETGLLMTVAQALAGPGRVAVVLAGGDSGAKSEVREAARRGWPIFVVAGTGGLSDELSQLWAAYQVPRRRWASWLLPSRFRYRPLRSPSGIADPDLREIVINADIRPIAAGTEPGQLTRRLSWELQDEPILKDAWQRFATYDELAARLRRLFTRSQASILLLGVAGTLLALIDSEVNKTPLHWAVVVLPILVSVLIAVASRRALGQRWVMMRAAAEFIKAEIFRYRVLEPPASEEQAKSPKTVNQQRLAAQLDDIEARLMQTEASSGPVTPYAGPLPPESGVSRSEDGLSRLTAERYLRLRIDNQLGYFHRRVRALNRSRNILQFLAVASGAAGAILAAANLEVWVGLTGGAAAAALAYLGYLQVDNTIVTYNQTAFRLAALERWWFSLDGGEQTETALERLVTGCETALATEQAGWVQQMNDTLEHLKQSEDSALRRTEPDRDPAGSSQHDPVGDAQPPGST
jgi:SLOG in TRPM, prokaryote/SMODS and SLOG-associating 2TM effector domain 1/SMODS and SLOG-associating 2TM effector domain 3